MIPPPQALRVTGIYENVDKNIYYDSIVYVIVTGPNVGAPGTYAVHYGCTYEEIFLLAQTENYEDSFPPHAIISMVDAVLLGDEYYVYLVV